MNIVYIIHAHKLPQQLVRLVHKLNTETTSFLIHVDKKADEATYRQMAEPLKLFSNVCFLKRHICNWGSKGFFRATLEGIRVIASLKPRYDYVILLTGQDYPIKSSAHIQQFLQRSNGKSFMEYFLLPNERWINENGGLDRVNNWYINWHGRNLAFFKSNRLKKDILGKLWHPLYRILSARQKILNDTRIFGGSAVWCLGVDCIEYIYDFVCHNSALVRFFDHVLMPEEIFFQTILLNSRLQDRIVNDDLRYIVWPQKTSLHPRILLREDANQLFVSEKLFARKFDITLDAKILDLIDEKTA